MTAIDTSVAEAWARAEAELGKFQANYTVGGFALPAV